MKHAFFLAHGFPENELEKVGTVGQPGQMSYNGISREIELGEIGQINYKIEKDA